MRASKSSAIAADPNLASDPSSRNGSDPRSATTIQRLVALGYITAIGMPPIGFVIGIVLMLGSRVKSRHGLWIVLASIAGVLVWVLVVSSGTLTATNQNY